jgi:hypothetical protein
MEVEAAVARAGSRVDLALEWTLPALHMESSSTPKRVEVPGPRYEFSYQVRCGNGPGWNRTNDLPIMSRLL